MHVNMEHMSYPDAEGQIQVYPKDSLTSLSRQSVAMKEHLKTLGESNRTRNSCQLWPLFIHMSINMHTHTY